MYAIIVKGKNIKIIVERHQDLPPVAMPMLPF